MTPNVVILCAAGMLVSAFLMVGQKSLFTTIRLYGAQSLLLATVAVIMAINDHRPHLFVMATMTTVLKGFVIPLFLMRVVDRIGIHREIEPFLNVPTSLLACLGLTAGRDEFPLVSASPASMDQAIESAAFLNLRNFRRRFSRCSKTRVASGWLRSG